MLCIFWGSRSLCHIHWALHYLKSHKCYEDITISKGLSNEEILIFSETELENVLEKFTQNEPPFTLTEDSLNMHITASNETTLVSQVPVIIDKKSVIIAPGQEKNTISVKWWYVWRTSIFLTVLKMEIWMQWFSRRTNMCSSILLLKIVKFLSEFCLWPRSQIFCQICLWTASSAFINKLCYAQN